MPNQVNIHVPSMCQKQISYNLIHICEYILTYEEIIVTCCTIDILFIKFRLFVVVKNLYVFWLEQIKFFQEGLIVSSYFVGH